MRTPDENTLASLARNYIVSSSRPPQSATPLQMEQSHAPEAVEIKYNSYAAFLETIEDLCTDGARIVKFSNVNPEEFKHISSERGKPLKSARFTYDFSSMVVTIKMPGFSHETVTGLFTTIIDQQLFAMNVVFEVIRRSSPLIIFGNWAKEPDACWAPERTDEITVVLEVGVSETADARGWIESPQTTVRKYITIDLNAANTITIKVWELGRRLYEIRTRSQQALATQTQHVEITQGEGGAEINGWKKDENGNEIYADGIFLEFSLFTGRTAANGYENDILIDKDLLSTFANLVWRHQHRPEPGH